MKKVMLILILCFAFLSPGTMAFNLENELKANQSNISKIECGFEAWNVITLDEERIRKHNEYSYCTESESEIKYLMHLINSFDFISSEEWCRIGAGYGISIKYNAETEEDPIEVKYSSDSFTSYLAGTIFKIGKQYDPNVFPDRIEYKMVDDSLDKFMEVIRAINRGDIVINESSSSQEISAWAEEEIKTAIGLSLVPKWNQINYQGQINRLETCQITANYFILNGYTRDKWYYKNVASEPDKINNPIINYAPAPFSDINDTSVNCMYGYEIVTGKEIKKFYPYDKLTREEFAKILSKAYHYVNKEANTAKTENVYADNEQISEWAIPYVNEMTALGVLHGDDDGCFDPQGQITKEQVIVALLRLYNLSH